MNHIWQKLRSNFRYLIIAGGIGSALIFTLMIAVLSTSFEANPKSPMSEEELRAVALKALQSQGLQDVSSVDDLRNSQTKLLTYSRWMQYMGTEEIDDTTLQNLGWSRDMPVFVMTSEGKIIPTARWLPSGEENEVRPTYDKLLVAVSGMDGFLIWSSFYPEDQPLPDLSKIESQ